MIEESKITYIQLTLLFEEGIDNCNTEFRQEPRHPQHLVQQPHITVGLCGLHTEEAQAGQSVVDVDEDDVVVQEIVPAQGRVGATGESSSVYEDHHR